MPTRLRKKQIEYLAGKDYGMYYWRDFDFEIFKHVQVKRRTTGKSSFWNAVVMADTETSRKHGETDDNHVCAWSIAFRAFHRNICTLWGQSPREFAMMLAKLRSYVEADEIYIYWHNLAYDWIFIRKFMFELFGYPVNQLNTKPLYPLYIKFKNGITFKDSLILAQRSLEKWAGDLNVEHKKAVGKWDYNKIRSQHDTLSPDELLYIENDVLAGVECIDTTMEQIGKHIGSIPYTATGIVRGELRDVSAANRGRDWFLRIQNEEYHVQEILELCFHGGYTHPNRYWIDCIINAICKDFSSSYPFEILTRKFPAEHFWRVKDEMATSKSILSNMDDYAFIFKVKCSGVDLFNPRDPMPTLLYSTKKLKSLNAIVDNGRVMRADYIECYMNEIDFEQFICHYKFDEDSLEISDCWCALKDYLPKWFTDYVFERYKLKCTLKYVDPVLYAIEKAKLNSCFGMCAQKPCKPELTEHYDTGVYTIDETYDPEAKYAEWRNKRSSFLPYSIGVWITSYAQRDLFQLGSCVARDGIWLYSDTDSVYANKFDEEKLAAFNQSRKDLLISRGYGPVVVDGEEFVIGEATTDGVYSQFKALHSKCYCTRPLTAEGEGFTMSGDLKLTVAGVPKKGAKSLKNNINNFKIGFVFPGTDSGKLQHDHHFLKAGEDIYIDEDGNETGDSISLSPCDYMIKPQNYVDMKDLMGEEVLMQTYEEE